MLYLSWEVMPYDSPEVLYDAYMAVDPGLMRGRLNALQELGVIDESRKADLAAELGVEEGAELQFVLQRTVSAMAPKEGSSIAPPSKRRSDFPSSFGFAEENKNFHLLDFDRLEGGKDIVLRIATRWNRDLVGEIKKRRLVRFVEDVGDPDLCEIVVKPFDINVRRDQEYFFKLNVRRGETIVEGSQHVSAVPTNDMFAWHKTNLFIAMLVLGIIIMSFARIAKRNPHKLFIRRLAGLDAVEEALGRAAEMGKSVFFCHGPGDLSSVVTISAINLLGKIAERVGEYGTQLKVTCLDYLVMQVSQDMVRDAYARVGRVDAYRDDDVMFVTGDTFAYSAAVGGMMIREKAGTAFFFGRFGSESLLLSETGAVTKAIQIAGTDSFTQIPFFITTCDYTLIGEEMYAGSAYLSREPRLVGAVKGQDTVKVIIITIIIVGTLLASFGRMWFAHLFWLLT